MRHVRGILLLHSSEKVRGRGSIGRVCTRMHGLALGSRNSRDPGNCRCVTLGQGNLIQRFTLCKLGVRA